MGDACATWSSKNAMASMWDGVAVIVNLVISSCGQRLWLCRFSKLLARNATSALDWTYILLLQCVPSGCISQLLQRVINSPESCFPAEKLETVGGNAWLFGGGKGDVEFGSRCDGTALTGFY